MSAFLSFLKALLPPALIAALLYLLTTYALLPLFRRYHQRHRRQLYLPLDTLSSHSTSLRHRLSDALVSFIASAAPDSWRWNGPPPAVTHGSSDEEDELFGADEGESMVGFEADAVDRSRRRTLERMRIGRDEEAAGSEARLSRDLEEGFRDDSDDSDEEGARS
ncbi:hypothetical protein W97_00808 [Coniosporium apollinis CBS 100218]|uniref:Uncharacterized protein n=1 Tax=Coniosporium apollinis (strain CBS 100218) TaxID=1168221 RepID=R7YI93_CONA1|nr:uncharacterized protein W97_00808 [Coniosporium apollinis CBS 100218]EON61593.1 hypothetical protein W97_00808 [Coniosporium apollinis CBS 100218]